MNKLKVCTLFSGYDSQCIALDQVGIDYELVAWAEIDKHAIKAHNALYPQWADRNLGDVSRIDWNNTDFGINLLTYSFPCTNISTAGTQAGAVEGSGTASSLLWECRRVIDIKRPKYLLMENVRNLLGKRHKEVFDKWCKTLEDFGYKNFYQIMNAEYYGVPQHRERVIMVSILCTEDDPDPEFEFPQLTELQCEGVDYLEDTDDETYYLNQQKVDEVWQELVV
ncbi:MAG: DNA (cytosine-5-)-methyltransferase [Prevotella sp.]|nr:DNA (cytosine-5-)-methyltransferase [Candidatus Prevotella equi]